MRRKSFTILDKTLYKDLDIPEDKILIRPDPIFRNKNTWITYDGIRYLLRDGEFYPPDKIVDKDYFSK